MTPIINQPGTLIALLCFCSLLPILMVVGTCFLKFSIVFSLLRSAIGLQQVPPNMALYGLSLILTGFVMAPVGSHIYNNILKHEIVLETPGAFAKLDEAALGPYRKFLQKHTAADQINFFKNVCSSVWKDEAEFEVSKDSLFILIPAFTVSQLIDGFKIGLLLYFPFIVIDLVVSNILLAMGMMMVSPLTIALPFKLLVFVLIGGWDRLLEQLVLSYA